MPLAWMRHAFVNAFNLKLVGQWLVCPKRSVYTANSGHVFLMSDDM
jgi:hypothetical protein